MRVNPLEIDRLTLCDCGSEHTRQCGRPALDLLLFQGSLRRYVSLNSVLGYRGIARLWLARDDPHPATQEECACGGESAGSMS